MTRIISGFAGSRELKVPKNGTRPTSDRVREAIFSSLEALDVLEGAAVLDLYAGSGALGLEALSRGAARVCLVEKNSAAAQVAKSNAALVCSAGGLADASVQVVSQSVHQYLASASGPWDVVFIDPPYEHSNEEVTEALTLLVSRLSRDAEVVVERSSRSGDFDVPSGLELAKSKYYGETTVYWLTRQE